MRKRNWKTSAKFSKPTENSRPFWEYKSPSICVLIKNWSICDSEDACHMTFPAYCRRFCKQSKNDLFDFLKMVFREVHTVRTTVCKTAYTRHFGIVKWRGFQQPSLFASMKKYFMPFQTDVFWIAYKNSHCERKNIIQHSSLAAKMSLYYFTRY